jgi:hypothetical protein
MAAATVSQAAPVLLLDSVSGAFAGQPGSTIGSGFQDNVGQNSEDLLIGVVLLGESDPSLGQFNYLLSPQGGPRLSPSV